jgi:hypothetical protein
LFSLVLLAEVVQLIAPSLRRTLYSRHPFVSACQR